MRKLEKGFQLSASDLVGYLNCRHLTALERRAAQGSIARPMFHDPFLELLLKRGAIHEANFVSQLESSGVDVVCIDRVGVDGDALEATATAMKRGASVIVQAALSDASWVGRADVLRRIAKPSSLGDWSYEVVETKLAQETRGGTILQLCLYADLLSAVQGCWPEHVYVVVPGADLPVQKFPTSCFAAYFRSVRRALEKTLLIDAASTYPDPVEHCDICRWRGECESRRRRDDHLCLVAGITKIQRAELVRHGVDTAARLASVALPLPWRPSRGIRQSYERVREQARVQIEARAEGRPVYELIPPSPGTGLAHLPAPSPGDIFLDLEADPFVAAGGLEYLFGYVYAEGDSEHYSGDWALSREQEQQAFERFIDFVMARWAKFPDMHLYHYASYEAVALKRLMGRYASRENEIDRMLRGGLFVDLFAVVKQSIRAGIESYTIKNLEGFYEFRRATPLADARISLLNVQTALELETVAEISEADRATVAGYNRDDCVSALKLRGWLELLRTQLIQTGASIERPATREPDPSEALDERQQKVAQLVARLTTDTPADQTLRTPEQHARWILAYSLDWHRRELKPAIWEKFRLAELPEDELSDERAAVCGLILEGVTGGTAKAPKCRYRFPPQEVDLRSDTTFYVAGTTEPFGDLEDFSLADRTLDIKKRSKMAGVDPPAVYGIKIIDPGVIPETLFRIGEHVANEGLSGRGAYQAARDLLLRRSPVSEVGILRRPDESVLEAAIRVIKDMSSGVLAIQGPPGAGKTYAAAHMICALVRAGRRVGVTANGHTIIRTVLDKVVVEARKVGTAVSCVQKPKKKQEDVDSIRFTQSNPEFFSLLSSACQVGGGTAFLWARPEAFESVDVLFVDEAAQMSLANVLAVSHACRTLVLLGDPRQLEQPMQGTHPDGSDVSALDYMLAGKQTIGDDQGLFIEETRRLHPDICQFTSEMFYEGRLRSHAGLERQTVNSTSRASGTGLRYLPVLHEGNQTCSPEEADEIKKLVDAILEADSSWIDRDGNRSRIQPKDMLIIAPYNAQVFELQERLPGYHIGTVDKFQGQEAAIVIYSMTSSSHADAPRGMEFLYSPNRLNVATSRAMCLCILVGSPALFEPECKTPRQMELANAFCRYRELAKVI
jgi:RecB family nuclease, putative, TM0106 family